MFDEGLFRHMAAALGTLQLGEEDAQNVAVVANAYSKARPAAAP
jgi:hypothetical protein